MLEYIRKISDNVRSFVVNCKQVALPFIVLHGEDDKVTDPGGSEQLCNVASSADKTLKLYPGMWHGLLYGEPLENIEIVFRDVISWLEKRVSMGLEGELKHAQDDFNNNA